ncbi:high mobility group B protein 7 [Cynara cardunculus var. scolymus]|uniref:high mobility group B protein 7 n=1 Tax=Cynara cardunculus var. scolymus TaxID=59895 RepID=UPI000D625F08|nr:high mobility group B protein 7 [Cynara cardunculus var. scolymus]
MAYQSRTRKRVNALRRAPDGSAFRTCESCGVSVAIALVDMHECESQKDVKRLKVEKEKHQIKVELRFQDQPRSEFRFFMESFMNSCDIKNLIEMDRKGFETWKNMSSQEKLPYKLHAKTVNDAYDKKLLKESEDQMYLCVDEEVDSAEVGKFDQLQTNGFYDYDDSDSYDSD